MERDTRVVACNYAKATSACAEGALCYVGRAEGIGSVWRIHLIARSRSGRWIRKWENLRYLKNFRLKTLSPEHPRYGDIRIEYNATETLVALLREASAKLP